MSIFVTAAAGTERALKEELRELRLFRVRADRGGVRAEGDRNADDADRAAAATVCLRSRVGVRVLIEVARFPCPHEDALYQRIAEIEWERWLHPRLTLAVSAVARDSRLRHTNFIAQRTKDAIVDRQRKREGRRSSVDRQDPDVAVFVHLKRDEAAVFLDASGGSLHMRGWRTQAGAAPLKETLAAALLRIAGWDRQSPLIDPMCGSGTFAIEADLLGARRPAASPGPALRSGALGRLRRCCRAADARAQGEADRPRARRGAPLRRLRPRSGDGRAREEERAAGGLERALLGPRD